MKFHVHFPGSFKGCRTGKCCLSSHCEAVFWTASFVPASSASLHCYPLLKKPLLWLNSNGKDTQFGVYLFLCVVDPDVFLECTLPWRKWPTLLALCATSDKTKLHRFIINCSECLLHPKLVCSALALLLYLRVLLHKPSHSPSKVLH